MSAFQISNFGNGMKLVNPESAEDVTNAIDLTSLRQFTATTTGATTWTFNNAPVGRKLTTTFRLTLTNGGSAAQTWPTNVIWSGNQPPALSPVGTEILQFTTNDNGATWYGSLINSSAASNFVPATFDPATSLTLEVPIGDGVWLNAFQQRWSQTNANSTFLTFIVNAAGVATNAGPAVGGAIADQDYSILVSPTVGGAHHYVGSRQIATPQTGAPYKLRITVDAVGLWSNFTINSL